MADASIDGDGIEQVLAKLDVPAEFAEYERTTEADVIVRLEEWRRTAYSVLNDLRTQLAAHQQQLTLEARAGVVCAAAQFDGDGSWVLDTTQELARELLAPYDAPDAALVEHILAHRVKPIFQKNPHPDVHPATGRRLPHSVGAREGALDYYEGQEWKRHPGMPHVLSWCVRHIEGTAYERLWHLVIPPVMTLLDDYEVRFKIPGVRIVSEMLDRVPPELLRRTGMDGLILTSLHKCFPNLRDPDTPALLRIAVPTCVRFIEATTRAGSAQRFDQLCAVLGDGVIGAVWFYSSRELAALEASLHTLPALVRALGVGVARYLKAVVPQLTYPLVTAPEKTTPLSVQLASARALRAVMAVCAPRMERWRGDILGGVCRCWVALAAPGAEDDGAHSFPTAAETDGPLTRGSTVTAAEKERHALRGVLQDVCGDLARICPSVVQDEYARLVHAAPSLFSALVAVREDM